MSESLEIKKAKIDSLVAGFTNSGFKSGDRVGQTELLQFLNRRSSSGRFDPIISEKLFEVLSLDAMSNISVEEFINGFLQFEEEIRKNAELFTIKFAKQEEIYSQLSEECRRYKEEKLNAEGLCENSKVSGEITEIDIKRKLEGIKEIIIKVVFNEKSEELHFKIGDLNSASEMANKTFEFKPTSRKDHFEFIMKGINERNQIFDIGSKIFPLTDVSSQEEYLVQIVVPEIENEEQIAAYIKAKIILYWSDYKYYEKQKKKAESKLKKLTIAKNKAEDYLRKIREIYGDLTRKKPDLIVDFNNEKLMQRKGAKLNVNFNNEKEAETPGGNYLVEFNNIREVKKTLEPVEVQFNNTKEVTETIKEEKINEVITETEAYNQANQPVYQQYDLPYITKADDEEPNVDYNNIMPAQETTTDYSYLNQTTTNTNYVQNDLPYDYKLYDGAAAGTTTTTEFNEYNQTDYTNGQQNDMGMAETIGYGSSENVEAYGIGGYELTDNNNPLSQLRDSQIIKETEIRTSINKTMVNESTKKTLYSHSILPAKILETKVKEAIVDNNVKTLPLIYGRKSITYENADGINNYNINNTFQSEQLNQGYTLEGQGNNEWGNIAYSTNI